MKKIICSHITSCRTDWQCTFDDREQWIKEKREKKKKKNSKNKEAEKIGALS